MPKVFLESIISHVRSKVSNKDREVRCAFDASCYVSTCLVVHLCLTLISHKCTEAFTWTW